MTLVLDASVTVAWVLKTERTSDVEQVIDLVVHEGAAVPSLWRLEVANVLRMAERRGRLSRQARDEGLMDLSELAIEVDRHTDQRAWSSTLRIADAHDLTVYDASYLELADRRGLGLATLDRALRRAADEVGVRLL